MKTHVRTAGLCAGLLLGWQGAAWATANLNIRVVDAEQPVSGVTVNLVDSQGNTVSAARDDNSDGIVMIPVTQPGNYQIVTRAPNGAEERVRVSVPASGSHALRVNLVGGAAANQAAAGAAASRQMMRDAGDDISYDYFQVGWIIDAEVEDINDEDVDGEGITLDASKSLGELFYLRGSSWAPNYDDDLVGSTEFALTDWQSVAVGLREEVLDRGSTHLDVFLQAGYDRLQVGGPLIAEPATGYGLAGGLRLKVNSFEVDLHARYADAEAGDYDVEPLLYGLDVRYRVTPNLALSVGYAEGDAEIKNSGLGIDEEPDLSMFTAGLRYYYGLPWSSSRAAPEDPVTSYNYLQFDYVVDGEVDIDDGVNDALDVDRGIGLEASYLLTSNLFLRAQNWTFDYGVAGSTTDLVLTDMLNVGPGLRYGMPVGKSYVDGYLQVTYDRMNLAGFATEGYGGEAGLRWMVLPGLEFNAWYREGRSEGDVGTGDLDVDPSLWGLRLVMGPENAEKWDDIDFVISFTDGEFDVDDGTTEEDIDFDALSFGVRYSY